MERIEVSKKYFGANEISNISCFSIFSINVLRRITIIIVSDFYYAFLHY